jgi:RHH-type rel operon transcriptional repressor/antitoxin RelB
MGSNLRRACALQLTIFAVCPTCSKKLSPLAKSTHRSKSYYVQRALEEFLADQEDHLLALVRLEKNNPRLTLEEMEKRLNDLED